MSMSNVIVISGTRKGIGLYLAEYYLSKGFKVIGCSRRETSLSHSNYIHYYLDVSNENAVAGMTREIYKEFGKIDILINNAGIAMMNHLVLTPIKKIDEITRTNYYGTFLLTREIAKKMILRKYGRIINFSSVAVPLALEGEAVYASMKSAIEMFTKISSKELANYNITVNAVAPAPVETDLIKNVPPDKISALLEKQAIKRFTKYEDISNVTDFFIDAKSNFITGQIIYLGGV
jgi:3-oxoacyl-[acyl-carrier protein] reductase